MSNRISRRSFLTDAAKASVAFTLVPRHVLGRGYRAPSDTLNVACGGVGGMGRTDVNGIAAIENVYALCDVDLKQGGESMAMYPKAKRYRDFREMLATDG